MLRVKVFLRVFLCVHVSIEYELLNGILTGTTTPSPSGPGSNDNKDVCLHTIELYDSNIPVSYSDHVKCMNII